MEQPNKLSGNDQFSCNVCKINFVSHAEYALHEFSKKHCDNLVKLAKNKVVTKKPKTKAETPADKEQPKINIVKHTGSFAKYGYFVPGEIYQTGEVSKEFNTDYDPYLQKFAENPYKEQPTPTPPVVNENQQSGLVSSTSFNRKKKKKIKTCQICNISLPTVPEYEAHMKSPQHIWKLKVTGMGVTAHFVKASTDLHTTDVSEESKEVTPTEVSYPSPINDNPSNPFPLLYCQDCELLLNSPQQYNAHIAGKSHLECAKRKAELKAKKEKLENPTPDQLYCYTCKISLNNLFQYNEHKNGKKHRAKCKQLIKNGITIPPEERVHGLPLSNNNYNKPIIYPELYEKFVLEKQKQEAVLNNSTEQLVENATTKEINTSELQAPAPSIMSGLYHCNFCTLTFSTASKYNFHISREHPEYHFTLPCVNNETGLKVPEEITKSEIIFHKNITPLGSSLNCDDSVLESKSETDCNIGDVPEKQNLQSMKEIIDNHLPDSKCPVLETSNSSDEVIILLNNEPLKCNICDQNFNSQIHFDVHVNSEDHIKKILDLKTEGTSDSEVLKIMFNDRRMTKADNLGLLSCSICNVTTENKTEFEQHLKSVVHKYAVRDYKNRKTAEVKFILKANEDGLYHCKLCKESWSSLVEFTQHLHFTKHRSIQSAERTKKILAKKRNLFFQKQKLFRNSKTGSFRIKEEKNPGVRTKISGIATDLYTGAQAPIPNLEPLEPKIDPAKNVTIGVSEKSNTDSKNDKRKIIHKKFIRNGHPNNFQGPEEVRAPYARPYPMPNRYWSPCSGPFPIRPGPFYGRPPMLNHPYSRPPLFQRPMYPRHPYGYR